MLSCECNPWDPHSRSPLSTTSSLSRTHARSPASRHGMARRGRDGAALGVPGLRAVWRVARVARVARSEWGGGDMDSVRASVRVILFVGSRAPSHGGGIDHGDESPRAGGAGFKATRWGERRGESERRGERQGERPGERTRASAPGRRESSLAGSRFPFHSRHETIDTRCGLWCSSPLPRAPFAFGRSLRSPYLQVHVTFIEAEAALTAKRVERARHVEAGEPRSERSRNAPGGRKREQAGASGTRVSVRANERRARPISLFQSASRYNGAHGRV